MSALKIRGLRKSYGNVEVIKGIDLDIEEKEFVVFVGPSGCGKSTLLRLIAGLENVTEGTIEISNKRVEKLDPSKRGIAMVFQSYALYPHMTVRENMGFALRFAGMAKDEIKRQVDDAARILELTPLLDRKPQQLSGGQRQRVAIGRAIVRHPDVFLFDEPLSNLDAELRVHTRLEIASLHQTLASTMIYVTHDQVEAMTLADKIVVLRDGLIEQVGTPLDLYENPQSKFVAQFIGSPKMNILEGEFAEKYNAASIGIRPEHFVLQKDGPWNGRVARVEELGPDSFTYVDIGAKDLVIIRENGKANAAPGDEIAFGPAHDDPIRFDAQGHRI